ncbi:hypothetical protein LCGC14_2816270, partial [marine sediment metagenome]
MWDYRLALAWLAGMIDGDGCISFIQAKHRKGRGAVPILLIGGVERKPLERALQICGG